MSLSPYAMADVILLVVETSLFTLGDMAVMTGSHCPFFVTDGMILCMETCSLCSADLAFPAFLVDTAVLVVQPAIDLSTARMLSIPFTILSERSRTDAQQSDESGGEK